MKVDAAELTRLVDRLQATRGWQAAYNLVQRAECALGLRRPRLALYDHAMHLVGGGQKYGCLLAAALRDRCDVTLIANRSITSCGSRRRALVIRYTPIDSTMRPPATSCPRKPPTRVDAISVQPATSAI